MKKQKISNRIISLLLALMLLIGYMPLNVYANNDTSTQVVDDATTKETVSENKESVDEEPVDNNESVTEEVDTKEEVKLDPIKETIKEIAPETVKETIKETIKETKPETIKETIKEIAPETVKEETVKEETVAEPKVETVKDTVKEETIKETIEPSNSLQNIRGGIVRPLGVAADGPVISADGKIRLTDFSAKWLVSTNNTVSGNTLTADIPLALNTAPFVSAQLQLDWALSGQINYKPGMLELTLPATVDIDKATGASLIPSLPMPRAIINADGTPDLTLDYGTAEYAWYQSGTEIKIVNVKELPAGLHGTATLSYVYNKNPKTIPDMKLSTSFTPKIQVHVSSTEKLNMESLPMNLKVDTHIDFASLRKTSDLHTSWNTIVNSTLLQRDGTRVQNLEKIKPTTEEIDKYVYILYRIEADFSHNQQIKFLFEDKAAISSTGIPQEFVGVWNSRGDFNPTVGKSQIDFNGPMIYNNGLQGAGPFAERFYAVVKVDKTLVNDGTKHTFQNNINMTISPTNPESNDNPILKTTNSLTIYTKADFTAPPGTYNVIKSPLDPNINTGSRIAYSNGSYLDYNYATNTTVLPGRVRELSSNGIIEKILDDKEVEISWAVHGLSQGGALTYDSTRGTPKDESAYGHKAYVASLADDYTFLDREGYTKELTSSDYSIRSVLPKLELFDWSLAGTGYKFQKITGDPIYNAAETVTSTLYGRKETTGEWVKLAELSGLNTSRYFTNVKPVYPGVAMKSGVGADVNSTILLPDGFTSVKLETESTIDALTQHMIITAALKPSDYMKDSMKYYQDNNITGKLRNDSTLAVKDSAGNIVAIKSTTQRTESNSRTLDLDNINYGEEMYHHPAYMTFSSTIKTPFIDKRSHVKDYNDTTNKKIDMLYKVTAGEIVDGYLDDGEEHSSGTFYDLLPLGAKIDEKSIAVFSQAGPGYTNVNLPVELVTMYSRFSAAGQMSSYDDTNWSKNQYPGGLYNSTKPAPNTLKSQLLPFTYEVIENYKDSGRTLLKVSYKDAKYRPDATSSNTGATLTFIASYDWDAVKDIGTSLRNITAFETGKSQLGNDAGSLGAKDNPSAFSEFTATEKALMTNLNPNNDNPSFVYDVHEKLIGSDTISNTGLTKQIRDKQDTYWMQDTKTNENSTYQYKLRLQSLTGTSTSNIVLYDSIENYKPLAADTKYGVNQWRGTFDSIDLTQVKMLGIAPKVYYSTVPNLDINANKTLTNTAVWSTTMPAKDKITAIAVDLSKTTVNTPFVLSENAGVQVTLNMKAPQGVTGYALNEIYANTTITTTANNTSENKLINTGYTSIYLEMPKTEVVLDATKEYYAANGIKKALTAGQFEFVMTDKADPTKTFTVKNNADGTIKFPPLTYHSSDVGRTFNYTIKEKPGTSKDMVYDSSIKNVAVTISRVSDTEIKATVNYTNASNPKTFINRDVDTAKVSIEAKKKYQDFFNKIIKLTAGDFTFELLDEKGNVIQTVKNTMTDTTSVFGADSIVFNPIVYHYGDITGDSKIVTFKVQEVAGTNPKITYDSKELIYKFEIKKVVDAATGKVSLTVTDISDLQVMIFDNKLDNNSKLNVLKIDADSKKPLSGARFELLDSNKKPFVHDRRPVVITTGIDGKASFYLGIPEGNYFLREVVAPTGYQMHSEPIAIDLKAGDNFITLENHLSRDINLQTGTSGLTALALVSVVILGAGLVLIKKKKD